MKRLFALILLGLLLAIAPLEATASTSNLKQLDTENNWPRQRKFRRNHGGTVGAPLDGGLLTILGAAGAAYFVSRKKKRGNE